MEIQQSFGETLKKIRIDKHISQEQFALKIGMDRTYYASVESGRRNISLKNIEKIADGFGISIADLFSMIEAPDNQSIRKCKTHFDPHLTKNQVLTEKQIHDIFECQTTFGIRMSKKNNLFVIMSGSARKKIYHDTWEDDILYYNGTDINSDEDANQTLKRGKGNNNYQLYQVWFEPEEDKHQIFLFEKHKSNECIYKGEVCLIQEPYLAPRADDASRKVWIFPLKLKD